MITYLKIDNFKQFDSIVFEKLKRINIISGSNNTGKTSILEAVFMFYDRGSPDFSFRQLQWRGISSMSLTPSDLWQPLFHNFSFKNPISITVKDGQRRLTAKYKNIDNYHAILHTSNNSEYNNFQSTSSTKLESLQAQYEINNVFSGQSNLYVNTGQVSLDSKGIVPLNKSATFLLSSSRGNTISDLQRLSDIDVKKELKLVTSYLKIFEPKLSDISIVLHAGQPIIYGDIGVDNKIPLAYLGEGIMKFLSLLITIISNKNSLICLDEIENGIHFSIFPKLWEAIDRLSKEYNCQLFITTHSSDFIKSLAKYSDDSGFNDFSFSRIDKVEGKLKPKTYHSEVLKYAIGNDSEIR